MSLLVLFWLGLCAILLGILAYGHGRVSKTASASVETPRSFSEFVGLEFSRTENFLRNFAAHLRPHGKRALVSGGALLKKGNDVVLEKLFGGIEAEKGKMTSFFLKRIAEHKDSLRGEEKKGMM